MYFLPYRVILSFLTLLSLFTWRKALVKYGTSLVKSTLSFCHNVFLATVVFIYSDEFSDIFKDGDFSGNYYLAAILLTSMVMYAFYCLYSSLYSRIALARETIFLWNLRFNTTWRPLVVKWANSRLVRIFSAIVVILALFTLNAVVSDPEKYPLWSENRGLTLEWEDTFRRLLLYLDNPTSIFDDGDFSGNYYIAAILTLLVMYRLYSAYCRIRLTIQKISLSLFKLNVVFESTWRPLFVNWADSQPFQIFFTLMFMVWLFIWNAMGSDPAQYPIWSVNYDIALEWEEIYQRYGLTKGSPRYCLKVFMIWDIVLTLNYIASFNKRHEDCCRSGSLTLINYVGFTRFFWVSMVIMNAGYFLWGSGMVYTVYLCKLIVAICYFIYNSYFL